MTSTFRTARWSRLLARGLALWIGLSAAGPLAAQPAAQSAVRDDETSLKTEVLILPLAKADAVNLPATLLPDVLGAATESLRSGLDASGRLAATVFQPTSPIVRRAVREQRITEADVAALNTPPVPEATVTKVADELGFTQGVVVTGEMATYTYDSAAGRVELSLSLTVENRGTEAEPKIVAVTGESKPVAGETEQRPLAIEAAQDAGRKAAEAIVQQVAPAAAVTPEPTGPAVGPTGKPLPPPATKLVRKRKVWTGVLAVLGAIALALVISGTGGGNGGTSGGNGGGVTPPPTNGGGEQPPPPPF